MERILSELKDGNADIPKFFAEAEALWAELLEDIDDVSIANLAEILHLNQSRFESICGERNLGKQVMGLSAMSHFYSAVYGWKDGDGQRAYKLAKAFEKSFCASEVKHAARGAADLYGVEEHA